MFVYEALAGDTDFSVVIRIIDSTDGTPETGVVFNTSGIDLEYRRELEASTDITEATLAALTTAHTDGGFLHIGNGYYRLDLPDAAIAAGVRGCLVHGTVTGMVVIGAYIHIKTANPLTIHSDIHSSLVIAKSQILIAKSDTSDIKSHLVVVASDLLQVYSDTTHIHSDTTHIDSDVTLAESRLLVVKSDTSDIVSALVIAQSRLLIVKSDTSDIKSSLVIVASDAASIQSDMADVATLTDLGIMNSTTIATLSTQTSFTLTAGSADNDAYNGCQVVITDASTAVQKCTATILDYTGATKTVTLSGDPGIFTIAVGDGIVILPPAGSGLDAAGVRGAIGLAAANLDTQLSDVKSSLVIVKSDASHIESDAVLNESRVLVVKSDTSDLKSNLTIVASDLVQVYSDTTIIYSDTTRIHSDTDVIGAAGAGLTSVRLSSTGVADVWSYVVEGTWTAVQFMRLFAAALIAKCSGMATTTAVFRDVDDTKNRLSVTVDADGNRSAFGTRDGD